MPTDHSINSQIRQIIDDKCRTDADLDAFVMDNYPSVQIRFSQGMDRVDKVNLLLQLIPGNDVLITLQRIFRLELSAAPSIQVLANAPSSTHSQPMTRMATGTMGSRSGIILHLTDLHFTDQGGHYWNNDSECHELVAGLPPRDRRGLLGSMLLDLERLGLPPDLIIVSGDLFDRAHRSGIDLALAFLNGLVNSLKLPRRQVVLIPGNHDVARGVSENQKYASFAELWERFYRDDREPFELSQPSHHQVRQFVYEDLGFEVFCFNSCEALEANQEHGSIGAGQRDVAEKLLRATSHRDLFRIGVLHHHLEIPPGVTSRIRPDYSEIRDAPLVREWMAEQGFRMVLHGHQHVACEQISVIRGWHLAVLAGGSAGVAEYGRKAWSLPLGYQVIQIDSAIAGRLVRRQYLPSRLEWEAASPKTTDLSFGPMTTTATIPQKDTKVRMMPDRDKLYATLTQLLDSLFNEVLFQFPAASPHLPSKYAPQSERAQALLGWAAGPGGPGLEAVAHYLYKLLPTLRKDDLC